jgi:hypothetical protein
MEGGWSMHLPALARIHDRVHDMFPHVAGFLDDSTGKEAQPIPQQLRVLWFREMSTTLLVLLFWFCKGMSFVRNPESCQ